jgi:hypothetical protein
MITGLGAEELLVAEWQAARRNGSLEQGSEMLQAVEEIDIIRCLGTDTQVLESDVLRAATQKRRSK